ncbi:MAG: restriction endonuclease, partial [Caldisphaera sp.]
MLTKIEEDKIVKDYFNGLKISEIAKSHNIGAYTVYRILRKHGIGPSRKQSYNTRGKITKKEGEFICKEYYKNRPLLEISEKIGRPISSVSYFIKRACKGQNPNFLSAANMFQSKNPSRELLESIVANVLSELGFQIDVNAKLLTRIGKYLEVDVWAEKIVYDNNFRVYVSCKNWNKEVDVKVINEEFGRTLSLKDIPHLKFIVVKNLTS